MFGGTVAGWVYEWESTLIAGGCRYQADVDNIAAMRRIAGGE